jgi:phage shock protein E
MKFFIVMVVLVILASGAVVLSKRDTSSNVKSATAVASQAAQALDFKTIQASLTKGGQLLDVRTAEEYATSHIDGATNFSLQDMQQNKLPAVAKDTPIYVYCHSGNRSGQATQILKTAGYTKVTDLGALTHVQSIGGILKQ